MLIVVYIDVSLGGGGFTCNVAVEIKCWWTVSLFS
jgi:hypothetical protein